MFYTHNKFKTGSKSWISIEKLLMEYHGIIKFKQKT